MRRVAIILGGLLVGVLLAALLLPWWLAPALRYFGRSQGVTFASYERLGYSRFALHDVRIDQPAARVEIARVEADTPLLWLQRRSAGTPGPVVVSQWNVAVRPPANEAAADETDAPKSIEEVRAQIFSAIEQLRSWVPTAELGRGRVTWAEQEIGVEGVTWHDRVLALKGVAYAERLADVRITFTEGKQIEINASARDDEWGLSLESADRELVGELRLWGETATLRALWPESGWIPAEAHLQAADWELPGARLNLGERYAQIRGDVRLDWRNGEFDTAVQVAGEPIEGADVPPLRADLRGRGDLERLVVESLEVEMPGVTARLTEPVVLDRRGEMQGDGSQFLVEADLAQLPWADARGRVEADVWVIPRDDALPRVEATLRAQEVAVDEWQIAGIAADAVLEWPRLVVERAVITVANGEQLAAQGGWDFAARELQPTTVQGTLTGGVLAPWLPDGIEFESVELDARAQGAIADATHEGRVRVRELVSGATKPLDVNLQWSGTGAAVGIQDGAINASDSSLTFAASVNRTSAELTRLALTEDGAERFRLESPATVRWAPSLAIEGLNLVGPDARIAVAGAWGPQGRIDVSIREVPSTWWRDFFEMPETEWTVDALGVNGVWDRGPIEFTAAGNFTIAMGGNREATAVFTARSEPTGVVIESLQVAEGAAPVVTASGRVPLTLRPDLDSIVQFSPDAPLRLQASTAPNPAFWEELTQLTGLELEDPSVSIQLAGTWARPEGEVRIQAARVSRDPERLKMPLPTIEGLDVLAIADRSEVRLEHLNVAVEGQRVKAQGRLQLSPEQWPELRANPLEYVRQNAELRLQIPQADMAAIARYVPKYLAPVGQLHVDAVLSAGGEIDGSVVVENAVSRPLGPLGVLQNIGADLHFSGDRVELRKVTAQMGGQPVTLSGTVEMSAVSGPRFDVALKGKNLPFVRQTGLLLRGDLDLKLVTGADRVTEITGTTTLRDSLFLSDIRALLPRGARGSPARRPPYFAIEVAPLSDWRLGVEVRGDEFIRLRTPVFSGLVSAYFRLTGTLGDPRAIGEAVIEEGQVLLPFASFEVQQGTVRLTEADPFEPQILLTGESRRYGYDLRMELSGPASSPSLTFSSSPPLDAEQVLLMVMAGETPRDEVSYSGRQRVTRLGQYLGQSLINSLGGDPTSANRLTISSGERISRQGRETYNIEYEVNDRLMLVGEYDEFDEYNAGIKWRLFTDDPDDDEQAEEGAGDEEN